MNILIVGCGKVGSCLANYLSQLGHDVSIVDRFEENFDMLDNQFSGLVVKGVPIDQDVLKRAGIQGCDALAALSNDDNMNIMVSQVAREIFHVPRVIARIYDPQRKDIFSHFGLKTICPTNITVEAVYSMLVDTDETKQLTFDSSVIGFDTTPLPKQFVGCLLGDIPCTPGEVLFAVLHEDGSITLSGTQEPRFRVVAGDRLIYTKVVD